ncbi:MAG TPA: sugar phosphate nucleotidyltransferase [Candidatus Hydrogenedentes bacterium]|nr:sugar phosphate nucleotidyltransferase [Candidatus Hydrogenedentota bacterium]
MVIRKAVITAAGRGARLYPVADTVHKAMLPLMDRDGLTKPVIQIIIEEALESGIEEVCIVCAPGDEEQYRLHLSRLRNNFASGYPGEDWARDQAARIDNILKRVSFAVQSKPLGYGHSVYCAREFVGEECFLLLLGDHLYISDVPGQRCAQQLIQLAMQENCAVAAVNPTREHLVRHYGTLSGKRISGMHGVYEIEKIIEKPSLSQAEVELLTPGLRAGHYLCLFGMHVLPHRIFDLLEKDLTEETGAGECQLTPALQKLAQGEKYLAAELRGARYDIGVKFGLMLAQIALGMAGHERDSMLTEIVELMADQGRSREDAQ